jgi:hypothetical protein
MFKSDDNSLSNGPWFPMLLHVQVIEWWHSMEMDGVVSGDDSFCDCGHFQLTIFQYGLSFHQWVEMNSREFSFRR